MLQNLLKLMLSFLLNWVEGKLISHIWQCKIPPSSGSASFVLWSSNTCEPQWMVSVTIVTHWLLTWPAQSAMISLGSDCSTDGEQSLHTSDAEIQKYNTFAGKNPLWLVLIHPLKLLTHFWILETVNLNLMFV